MGRRTFRACLWMRSLLLAAAAFWTAVLAAVVQLPGVRAHTILGAALFVLFFAGFGLYYVRMAVLVDGTGVTFRGTFGRLRAGWDDILRVEVWPGLTGPTYAVLTRHGLVHFTGLLARHRELLALVLDGAGLAPSKP